MSMTEERVNEIIDFWEKRTGRQRPVKVSLDENIGIFSGLFCLGEIRLHPGWADEETLFHELTHLAQWQDGSFWYRFDFSYFSWGDGSFDVFPSLSPPMPMFKSQPAFALPYLERPAEIEARKKSEEWLELFSV